MLKLRLSMGGTKKRPVYKIVVADSRFPVSYTHLTLPTTVRV